MNTTKQIDITSLLAQATTAHNCNLINLAEQLYKSVLQKEQHNAIANYNLGCILLRRLDISGDELIKRAMAQKHPDIDQARAISVVIEIHLMNLYQDHAIWWINFAKQHQLTLEKITQYEQRAFIPDHLAHQAFDHTQNKTLARYHPVESSNYVYAIDIVGGCNLRCPTCPVSNQSGMPKGLMSAKLFDDILSKITREWPTHKPDIWLFNWGEPLLHPHIAHFITQIKAAGLTSFISSNLNIGLRIDEVMQASPDQFKVSLSSLRQEIYSRTHERGDIKQVIQNLTALAKARDKYHAHTDIWIGHHLYTDTQEESNAISALAKSLGFGYRASHAIIAPVEKSLRFINNPDETLSSELQTRLIKKPITITQELATQRSGNKDCELRFNMTSINYDGSISLCCATIQSLQQGVTSFLNHSKDEIESLKYKHPFCNTCMTQNLHVTIKDK